jgi:hypothetical protein
VGTWTNAATATAATSVNVTGLAAASDYDWRVRANCSSSPSNYVSSTFTTATAPLVCPDNYEPNDVLANAKTIASNSTVTATIDPAGDKDYYSFSTSGNQKNFKVTVTAPSTNTYNVSLTLYNSAGAALTGVSYVNQNTTSVTASYNTNKAGTYKILVSGATGTESNSAECYTLNLQTGNGTFTANTADEGVPNIGSVRSGGLKLYPVPATNAVTISFDGYAKGTADISIINQLGQPVLFKKVSESEGTNLNTIDVSKLKAGVYTLKVNNGKQIQTKKMIISR